MTSPEPSANAGTLILVAGGVQPLITAQLRERFPVIGPLASRAAASIQAVPVEQASRVRILVTLGSNDTPRAAFESLPALELIACTGAGFEGVDMGAARARGVVVSNSPGASADSVADLAVALLIASMRGIFEVARGMRAGAIIDRPPVMQALTGNRAGIYGYGAIGARVARRLEATGMQLGYCSKRWRSDVAHRYFSSVLALAEWADVLVLCVPATPQTVGSVDASVLAALGPDGHVVNVGRASVVDTRALCSALESRVIAGAALDVFEPQYQQRLATLPYVTLTPHIGGSTAQAEQAMAKMVMMNIEAFLRNGAAITCVALTE